MTRAISTQASSRAPRALRAPVIFAILVFSSTILFPAISAALAPEEFAEPEYDAFVGDWQPASPGDNVAQVLINKDSAYQANVLMAFDDDAEPLAILTGTRAGGEETIELRGKGGWTATLRPDCCGSPHLEIGNPQTKTILRPRQYARANARLRAPVPEGAVVMVDLRGKVLGAEINAGEIPGDGSVARLHVEFRFSGLGSAWGIDWPDGARIVLTPSFGQYDGKTRLCGTLAFANKSIGPLVRAERSLQEWQALDIEKNDGGMTVFLNGVPIHKNVSAGEKEKSARARLVFTPLTGRAQLRNAWLSVEKREK